MHDQANPEVLVRVRNEMEGGLIIGFLEEHGIPAEAVGAFTSGFRAEAPGDVTIVVRAQDLSEARRILEENQGQWSDADWSQVDVGEPEQPAD